MKNYKRVEAFESFIKKTNEEKAIEVSVEDWWEPCQNSVLSKLHQIAGDPIKWESLLNYARLKNNILSRESSLFVDDLVLGLIKDIIWELQGEDLYVLPFDTGSTATHSKALAIETLSKDILTKVKIESGLLKASEENKEQAEPVANISVNSECDELPFEHKNKNIFSLNQFSKLVEETYCHLKIDSQKQLVEYVLNILKEEDKDLRYDKILKTAKSEVSGKTDIEILDRFLTDLIDDCIKDQRIEIRIDGADPDDKAAQKEIERGARQLLILNVKTQIKSQILKGGKQK